jgi:hypothetical protein
MIQPCINAKHKTNEGSNDLFCNIKITLFTALQAVDGNQVFCGCMRSEGKIFSDDFTVKLN